MNNSWIGKVLEELNIPLDGAKGTTEDRNKVIFIQFINRVFDMMTDAHNELTPTEQIHIIKVYIKHFEAAFNEAVGTAINR